MNKKLILGLFAATLTLSSCGGLGGGTASAGGNGTGNILGSGVGETVGNIISSVISGGKLSQESLVGTWKYDGPGCAFTSENVLARVGGEVAASQVEQKLAAEYSKLGFTASNTQLTFDKNGNFTAKINGKSWKGTYTYNPSDASLQLKGLLLNLNGYVVRNGMSGISVLFESKKVLTLFQTLAAVSGNSTAQVVSDISKNYDGVRIGFDMKK